MTCAKQGFSVIYIILIVLLNLAIGAKGGRREDKVFSLFNIVRFPNSACSGDSYTGTCLTSTECSSKGGSSIGSCASGFGTCCFVAQKTCGGSVSENLTYIQNPGYDGSYDGSSSCGYTIKQMADDICFIRLDFDKFITVQPATDGGCPDSFFADNAVGTAKSPAGNTVYPPIICGVNTGQHMYLDAGKSSTANMAITNTFSTTTTFSRYWSIKISQIECDSPAAPPESTCLQYFTGATGIVKSFNFDSTSTTVYNNIKNQVYTVCIRREINRCSILYVPTDDTYSFKLDGKTKAMSGANKCFTDYIIIPRGTTPGVTCVSDTSSTLDSQDRFCGGKLSCADKDTSSHQVLSSVLPFEIKVVFTKIGDTNTDDRGFALGYTQNLC